MAAMSSRRMARWLMMSGKRRHCSCMRWHGKMACACGEALRLNVDLAIAQPSGMVASGFREGFILDWKNCEVDYLFTFHPQRHIGDELWKCSVSADPAQLDAVFAQLASRIEAIGAYQVVRSTDTIIDITPQGCSKAAAVEAVLDMLGRSFDDAAAIGDGGIDVQLIRRSGLGVTLEMAAQNAARLHS